MAAYPLNVSSRKQADNIHAYMGSVCRIVVRDEKGQVDDLGTGFLVGPNLLMTCNHVIPDLETAQKAEAQFFKHSIEFEHPTGGEYDLYPDSYLRFDLNPSMFFHSPAPHQKRRIFQPADQTHLDYTIIPLQPDLSLLERVPFSLFKARAPKLGEHHYLYQHPEAPSREPRSGMEVKGAFGLGGGSIVKTGTYECHYATPTAVASSGGPAVGNDGNLIALHYQTVGEDKCQRPPKHICNAGVNMDTITKHLGKNNLLKIKIFNRESPTCYPKLPEKVSAIIKQIKLIHDILDRDPFTPLPYITTQANLLYGLIISFVKDHAHAPPNNGQDLSQPLESFEQILSHSFKTNELKIALSRSYYLLLEIIWYQNWHHFQQPSYDVAKENVTELTNHLIRTLPREIKLRNGNFISTIDTKFFLQCAQQAAQCLSVQSDLWQKYQKQSPSEASLTKTYEFLNQHGYKIPLEDWYIINWKLNWLSNGVVTFELFKKEIEPILESYHFSGAEYTIAVTIAFMTILKNPQADPESKDQVFHGSARHKGLKDIIDLGEKSLYHLALAPSRLVDIDISWLWEIPDPFKEARYLAEEYLFQLATENLDHPYRAESLSILTKKSQEINARINENLRHWEREVRQSKEELFHCYGTIDYLQSEVRGALLTLEACDEELMRLKKELEDAFKERNELFSTLGFRLWFFGLLGPDAVSALSFLDDVKIPDLQRRIAEHEKKMRKISEELREFQSTIDTEFIAKDDKERAVKQLSERFERVKEYIEQNEEIALLHDINAFLMQQDRFHKN